MADDRDWRLRLDVSDAELLHARLRATSALEHSVEPGLSDDVVVSADEHALFAYARTRPAIDEARAVIERQLVQDGISATIRVSHWDNPAETWRQVEPAPDAEELALEQQTEQASDGAAGRDARVETRTVAVTSGRMVRNWFESTVADEAKELGVELSIVEHPHLLSTQIAFTLTGPAGKVDELVADLELRAGAVTRLEGAYLTPL